MSKQLTFNLIANIFSFLFTFLLGFFLTPYIVKTLGADAYGFVSLADNIVNYMSLATVALNSMAARFVAIKVHQGNLNEANRYFSSVFFANIITSVLLLIPSTLIIIFLENLINIPNNLITDVKILLTLVFFNFFISLITSIFNVTVLIKNKLYLSSLRGIEGAILRCLILILLFSLLPAKIYYLSIAAFIMLLYLVGWNIYYLRNMLPEIEIGKKSFDFCAIKELVSAGIWNLVNRLYEILAIGVDLLLVNLFINATQMGILSISATIPSLIISVLCTLSSVFAPEIIRAYARNNFTEMTRQIMQSIKLLSIFSSIPLGGFIAYGDIFYALWMPTQNSAELYILSILKILGLIFSASTTSIYELFTITNKLKLKSIVNLVTSSISIIITLLILNITDLGIYAVAGISSILGVLQYLIFTLPYAAKCIEQKWYIFFYPTIRSILCILVVFFICNLFRNLCLINTWYDLVFFSIISGLISFTINITFILSKSEKEYLFNSLRNKIVSIVIK